MNVVREIERINERELELNVPESASWHAQYSHSAYIFIAALDYELTEGDIICIASQ
jgi:RNA-binding motif protein, X-linked 2